jgi:hypothetical protein
MNELAFKELEYKYCADGISLRDFQALMTKIIRRFPNEEIRIKDVSSWDTYFTKPNGDFCRYRNSELRPELTIKRKLSKNNNQKRIEVNVPLDCQHIRQDELEQVVIAYTELEGYQKNFKIYKTCFIYFIGPLNYVFYIVYDENMNEQRKFIEIEFDEEVARKMTEEEVFARLDEFEALLAPLGINSKKRLKKSLFEMFRR